MKESCMIEPNSLAGGMVSRDRRPHLPGLEPIVFLPFKFDAIVSAVFFHFYSVRRLEDCFPPEAESVSKVANVHPPFYGEALSQRGTDPRKDSSAIRDGGLSTLASGSQAEEIEL